MLRDALESAVNQTYKNLEIIVNDNNSTDGTRQEIEDLLLDERVKYYKSDNDLTMLDNWSSGFSRVTGDIFFRLDDDNVLKREFVSTCVETMSKHNLDVISYSALILNKQGLQKIFDESEEIFEIDSSTLLLMEFHCLTDSNYTLYKTDIIKRVIGSDKFYQTTLPDRHFNYRLAEAKADSEIRYGFSTKVMGITRYDYKPANSRAFFINKYEGFYEENYTTTMEDCQFNFQMHRAHCAYVFLKKCKKNSFINFFERHLLDKKMMRSYCIFGHINQWLEVRTLKELIRANLMFWHGAKDLILNPQLRIHGKIAAHYIFAEIYRMTKLNLKTITQIFIPRQTKEVPDKRNAESGTILCRNFVNGEAEPYKTAISLAGNYLHYIKTRKAGLSVTRL